MKLGYLMEAAQAEALAVNPLQACLQAGPFRLHVRASRNISGFYFNDRLLRLHDVVALLCNNMVTY